jgi:hypothetical protein
VAFLQLGTVDDNQFNSTTYPGICRPSNKGALAIFKNLQAQLNRVAQGAGLSKITVDGDLGNATLALFGKIAAFLSQGGVSIDPARNMLIQAGAYGCVEIARNADALAMAATGVANQMNIPPKISQPSGVSTIAMPGGGTQKITTPTPAAASLVDSLSGMDPTTLLMAAGAVGAVIYFSGGKGKRSSRASTKSSRRHSRRHSNYRYR